MYGRLPQGKGCGAALCWKVKKAKKIGEIPKKGCVEAEAQGKKQIFSEKNKLFSTKKHTLPIGAGNHSSITY